MRNCVLNNYQYQCSQVKSNLAAPSEKKRCTRKNESEKAATTSTGTRSAADEAADTVPEAENCR